MARPRLRTGSGKRELLTVQRTLSGVQQFRRTVTASYTLLTTDDVVLVDATSGATSRSHGPTRPVAFSTSYRTVKKIDSSSHAVTFASTIAATSTAATFDGVTEPDVGEAKCGTAKRERSNGVQYYSSDAGVTAIFTAPSPPRT